jgi:hypothetical protein
MALSRLALAGLMLTSGCYVGASLTDTGGDDSGGPDTDTDTDADSDSDGEEACSSDGTLSTRASLRRLTRFEYNNTVRDLLGDDTRPANAFPSEEIGNGFGNDADAQPVSSLLAEQYNTVAEDVAQRATATPEALGTLATCAADITATTDAATEQACAQQLIEALATRAYRRPLAAGEADELFALHEAFREESDFATSIAGVIEAILQSPDFLYRIERGTADEQGRLRPTGHEMATRLSYLLWGTMPDEQLLDAAEAGELATAEGVHAHATRMLDDERSRPVIRFFFDNLLPISALASLERDPARYPTFTAQIGALMREETQTFLEHEIFAGSGTWPGVLTAPYTFVNQPLAEYYGIAGVEGDEFQRVELDTSQRLGLLTQAGVVAGTIHSNETNPVVRGAFIVRHIMCNEIPLPSGDVLEEIKPPDPGSGATARERFSQHSEDVACAGCHALMDPVGLAFENYDPVGLWRDNENGVTIDASGAVPGVPGTAAGPVELVELIASSEATHACFAESWSNFAYGRTRGPEDACSQDRLAEQFVASGYDIRELLLALTQSDDFLYLPEEPSP